MKLLFILLVFCNVLLAQVLDPLNLIIAKEGQAVSNNRWGVFIDPFKSYMHNKKFTYPVYWLPPDKWDYMGVPTLLLTYSFIKDRSIRFRFGTQNNISRIRLGIIDNSSLLRVYQNYVSVGYQLSSNITKNLNVYLGGDIQFLFVNVYYESKVFKPNPNYAQARSKALIYGLGPKLLSGIQYHFLKNYSLSLESDLGLLYMRERQKFDDLSPSALWSNRRGYFLSGNINPIAYVQFGFHF